MSEEKSHKEPENNQTSPESPCLRRAIDLTTSLISLSHSIKVFAVKWQTIRIKLDELLSGLTAIENCDSGENPSLSCTVQATIETLTNCYDLARSCAEVSYSGKLLMQSDLDIITSRFNTHINNLSEIYTNGLLNHNYAIVVSRPSFSASRDDMKFYVNDLESRLKIGGSEMKKQALIAFKEVIVDDDKYIKIAVEIGGIIGLLVNFLDSQETQIQEQASESLSIIASFEAYRSVLVESGVIAPLIRVLERESGLGKEFGVKCLQKLTENSENAWSVSAHGGVTVLLKICRNSDSNGDLVGLACGVLRNLLGVEEIKRFMIEDGAIKVFIKLVRSKYEILQINSIELLQILASRDELTRQLILKEGGIRALVRVLDPNLSFSSKSREMALRAIANLCFSSVSSLSILMNYGFIDHILYFLRNGELSVQELALKAAFGLCGKSEEAKKAMGDLGFMPELVKLLDAKSFEVRDMAAETLSTLVLIPRNRKIFVQNDQNVGLLLQFLDPEEGNSGKMKFLLSTLISLTSIHSGRKKIVNSGYVKKIEKLAEAQVSDAKKIVRKLSSNRLRSMFSGIWHS